MKNLFFLLALLGSSFKVNAQQMLAYYGLNDHYDVTLPPSTVNSVLVSASVLSSTGFIGFGSGVTGGDDWAACFNDWPIAPQTFDEGKYVELTLSAKPGKTVEVDSLKFWKNMRGINHPQNFFLRSSYDNFTSNIYSDLQTEEGWQPYSITTPDITIIDGSSVTFRFYAGGTTTYDPIDSNYFDMMLLDNILVYGDGDLSTGIVSKHITNSDKPIYPNPARVGEIVCVPPDSRITDSSGRMVQTGDKTFVPRASGLYIVGTQTLIVE